MRAAVTVAVLLGIHGAVLCAADVSNAQLVAGTVEPFRNAGAPIKGKLDVLYQPTLVFVGLEKPVKGESLSVPFDAITTIEQGDKPGPKGSTVALATAAFGLAGFLATRSGPVDQYVTVEYQDGAAVRTVVFLLPAKFADGIVTAIEKRSGRTRVRATTATKPAPADSPQQASGVVVSTQPPSAPLEAATVLSNQDVVDMVKAGLSEDVVLLKIKASRTRFDTSPQGLIGLRQAGVSNAVIAAMIGGTGAR